jgi:DNA-binding MarR family transcriptional regulator
MAATDPESTMVDLEDVDLTVLATAFVSAVTAAVAERMAAAGRPSVRPSWGYLLQHLIAEPVTAAELARRTGISKQAAAKAVAELRDRGLVEPTGPGRELSLTAAGHDLVLAARRVRAGLDDEFAAVLGPDRLKECADALVALVDHLGGRDAVRERRILPPS